ncbi:MAG: hypothetical protein FI734_04150 [SAR202 cluster bacterium]|nr:hypothetical protein [SAR202 cluster bacterium]
MTSTITKHSRAMAFALLAFGLMFGLVAGSMVLTPNSAFADGDHDHYTGLETIAVENVVVDHELGKRTSKKTVKMWGSGFKPGQEFILMINDGPGAPTDITNYTTPHDKINGVIIANDRGAWATTWKVHRFTRKRSGIGPGDGDVERMRAVSAVDPSNFEVITTAPLAFCRVTDRANATATAASKATATAAAEAAVTEFAGLTKPEAATDATWGLIGPALDAHAAAAKADQAAADTVLSDWKASGVYNHCPN